MAYKSYEEYARISKEPAVRATLDAIAAAEGTKGKGKQDGYDVGFGYNPIGSLDAHPQTVWSSGNYRSSAAGRYQALSGTWNEVAKGVGIKGFSQLDQDVFAIARADVQRGALKEMREGDIAGFTAKTNKEWASFPGSPYGQGTRSASFMQDAFNEAKAVHERTAGNPLSGYPDISPTHETTFDYGYGSVVADALDQNPSREAFIAPTQNPRGSSIAVPTISPRNPASQISTDDIASSVLGGVQSGLFTPTQTLSSSTVQQSPVDAWQGQRQVTAGQQTPLSPEQQMGRQYQARGGLFSDVDKMVLNPDYSTPQSLPAVQGPTNKTQARSPGTYGNDFTPVEQPSFIGSSLAQNMITPQQTDLAAQYGMYTNPDAKAYYDPIDAKIAPVIGPNPQAQMTKEEQELIAGQIAAEKEAKLQRQKDPTKQVFDKTPKAPDKQFARAPLAPEKQSIFSGMLGGIFGQTPGILSGIASDIGGILGGRDTISASEQRGIAGNMINPSGLGDLTTGRGMRYSSSGLPGGTSVYGGPSANFNGYDAHTNNYGVTTVSNDNMSFTDNSSGEGGKVLCTHYHSIGWLPDDVYAADSLCGLAMPVGVVSFYHWWAKPLVKQVRKHKWLETVLWPFVNLWAHSMYLRFKGLSHG